MPSYADEWVPAWIAMVFVVFVICRLAWALAIQPALATGTLTNLVAMVH